MSFRAVQGSIEVSLRYITIAINVMATLFLLIEVVARYIFNYSLGGLSEVTLILVMWLYMLGASIACDKNSHLRIGIASHLIKGEKSQALYRLSLAIISLIIVFFFIRWAYGLLMWGIRRPQTTPILSIPWISSQSSIFVASLLFAFYGVRDVLKSAAEVYRSFRTNTHKPESRKVGTR